MCYSFTWMVVLFWSLSKILPGNRMSLGPWRCFKAMLAEQLGIEVHGILGQCPSASGIEALKGTRKRLRKSEEDLQDLHLDTVVQKNQNRSMGTVGFLFGRLQKTWYVWRVSVEAPEWTRDLKKGVQNGSPCVSTGFKGVHRLFSCSAQASPFSSSMTWMAS